MTYCDKIPVMKLKEVAENLVGAATKVTKLGIQEEIRHPKLIKTSTALDLRAIGLAVLHKDLKDDVVIHCSRERRG